MLKRFWPLVCVVMLAMAASQFGRADQILGIEFTQSSGTDPLPVGTIDYDPIGETISASIEWDGYSFHFPDSDLIVGAGYSNPSLGCPIVPSSAQAALDNLEGCAGPVSWSAASGPGVGSGSFNISDPAGGTVEFDNASTPLTPSTADSGLITPEPAAFFLTTIGFAALFMAAKRLGCVNFPRRGHLVSAPPGPELRATGQEPAQSYREHNLPGDPSRRS